MIIYDIAKLKEKYPDGYKMPASERALNRLAPWIRTTGIECGEFVRLITGHVGPNGIWKSLSPIANKKELVDPERVPQAGDIFVQKGGKWGHIGIVLRALPNGKDYDLDVVDANAKVDGVIRYRKIKASSCYGFGYIGHKEKWELKVDDVIPSPIDENDYTPDQVNLDGEKQKWKVKYREQGGTGMCAAFAVASAVYALTGKEISPLALFVEANDTYGNGKSSFGGITYRNILRYLKNYGAILEKHVNFGDPWKESHEEKYLRARKEIKKLGNVRRYKFKYIKVAHWSPDEMHKVLALKSPILTTVDRFKGWHEGVERPESDPRGGFHAICLYNYANDTDYKAIDSLRFKGDDDGIRDIHLSAIVETFALIPNKEEVVSPEEANRYGKPKDFKAEGVAQAKIQEGISYLGQNRLTDAEQESMWQDFARNRQQYINAVAYGDYNVLYIKWGFWQPGDLANYMYAKIKGRALPFDLTKPRNKQ